jgi:hypothetical protein
MTYTLHRPVLTGSPSRQVVALLSSTASHGRAAIDSRLWLQMDLGEGFSPRNVNWRVLKAASACR